jgi:ADP-heptose:LPS heptosyltransferase
LVTWVTKEEFAPLLREDPRVHRLVELRRGASLFALAQCLEPLRFDLILDAHGSLRSRMLPWLLQPVPIRRLAKDTPARLWRLATGRRTSALRRRMTDRLLDLLDTGPIQARPRIVVPGRAERVAGELLGGDRPWLAVAPGARHGPKRWPVERFAAVVRRFQQEHESGVVILGGPGEEELGARIARDAAGPCVDWTGLRDLAELAGVLQRSRWLLCNDSGLLHLSEAVGTPVLALFGPTSRDWGYFPLDERSAVVDHELECRPCSRNGARACRLPEQLCMTRSTVDLVYATLEERWVHASVLSP